MLCLHWPLHAPTTTQGRKYVALLFCTDFALSFPRDVCRYICIKDHLMHGLHRGYFASGYKPSTSIWINCEMHLLANIQITLLYYRTFYTIPHFCRGEMCLCAQLLLLCCVTLMTMVTVVPRSCICHDSSGVTLSSSAL